MYAISPEPGLENMLVSVNLEISSTEQPIFKSVRTTFRNESVDSVTNPDLYTQVYTVKLTPESAVPCHIILGQQTIPL